VQKTHDTGEKCIKIRRRKLTTLRKYVRAQILAQRRMLFTGRGLDTGHENPYEIAHGGHRSGPQSWGWNTRSTV